MIRICPKKCTGFVDAVDYVFWEILLNSSRNLVLTQTLNDQHDIMNIMNRNIMYFIRNSEP